MNIRGVSFMKRLKKTLILVLMVIISTLAVVNTDIVYAEEKVSVDSVKYIEKDNATITEIVSSVVSLGFNEILSYNPATGMVSFSNKKYNVMNVKRKNDFMKYALGYIKESGLSPASKNKLYHFIESQDGTTAAAIKFLENDASADFVSAIKVLKPFSGFVGGFLGVMCLVIFATMGISIVWDVAYLTLPWFAAILEDKAEDKPFGVSVEAWKSKRESEARTEYVGPMGLFLKRRGKVLFLASLCLMYLVSGQIYEILSWIVDSFSNIFI